jgi:hypothetical protein
VVKQTQYGGTVITNRKSPQLLAFYDSEPLALTPIDEPDDEPFVAVGGSQADLFATEEPFSPGSTIMATDWVVDDAPKAAGLPASEHEIIGRLKEQGLKAYRLNLKLREVPVVFAQETRPVMADMSRVSASVATVLPLNEDKISFAVRAAYNLLRDREIHTELTKDEDNTHVEEITVITDRASLTRDALQCLRNIRLEEADAKIIIGTLAARLREDVAVPPSDAGAGTLDDKQLDRLARDAACWVVRRDVQKIGEMIQDAIAEAATVENASPLPDFLLYPLDKALIPAQKNLYGVIPPMENAIAGDWDSLDIDGQTTKDKNTLAYAGGSVTVFGIDGSAGVNEDERKFIESLERDDHVVWWHRNSPKKRWSVRIVRSDHRNYFYPDFVVYLEYPIGEPPAVRMIETKHDTKDASKKAQRRPTIYGKVLFVTRDDSRLRIVNDDGSLGAEFDWIDLSPAWRWMAATSPKAFLKKASPS